jgi:hypothetical protein
MKLQPPVMVLLCMLLLIRTGLAASEPGLVVDDVLRRSVGLNDAQIRAIHSGKALAVVMDSPTADEVFVFGAVHVEAMPESYLKFASDLEQLRRLPSYLAVREFSSPPQLSDLDGFAIGADDCKDLRNCKPGDCELQLPSEAMEDFQRSINWSGPDVAGQVNRLARQMAFEAILKYQQGGNAALGLYRDKNQPTKVAETFESLLSRLKSLPVYLPELNQFLLEYPQANQGNMESDFYWEKVNFGLKPTLRIVQRIIYRSSKPDEPACAIALKQLYASHYFQTALDLTVCIRDTDRSDRPAIYLITVKASQQAGLTGLKGSILRKVAVDKTRSSLERALIAIRKRLEAPGR